MTGRLIVLVVALAALLLPTLVHAAVLDFEDLWTGSEYPGDGVALPGGYHGFTWSDAYSLTKNAPLFVPSGYNNVIQGHVGVYAGYGNVLTMGGQLFDFNSAVVGAGWNDDQGVTFEGYLNGNLVASRYLTTDVFGGLETFNFMQIDTLWVTPDANTGVGHYPTVGAGHHIVLDNIEYNNNAVPEPGSLSLLALAFGGVGAVVRRRKKA